MNDHLDAPESQYWNNLFPFFTIYYCELYAYDLSSAGRREGSEICDRGKGQKWSFLAWHTLWTAPILSCKSNKNKRSWSNFKWKLTFSDQMHTHTAWLVYLRGVLHLCIWFCYKCLSARIGDLIIIDLISVSQFLYRKETLRILKEFKKRVF